MKWLEGVTPTYQACQHGAIVATGTYMRDMVPTGNHFTCWLEILAEQEEMIREYYAERWAEYYSMVIGGSFLGGYG